MRLRATIALHLLHLSLNLRLCLRFVHALADQDVHQQNLLLARSNGRILIDFLGTRVALNLKMRIVLSWEYSTHLS